MAEKSLTTSGKLYGKVFIEGKIISLTGLHIGTGKETMEIGGVDMPVVRDPLTREPYIPGSSIKGKMRSLLEKFEFARGGKDITPESYFSKIIKSGSEEIRHHECGSDNCSVCRLYGASKGNGVKKNRPARIYVHDAHLIEDSKEELQGIDTGLYLTELKYENTLDRLTSAASPRQIERVPKGAEFKLSMVYNQDEPKDSALFKKDLESIFTSILLLKDDALGGSVSRGYGRIDIQKVKIIYRDAEYYTQENKKEIVLEQGESEDLKTFLFERVLKKLTK
ncbi:CRISPR-associated protein Csm3 [Thermoanaerobacter thermohydrosulfuricus]|nr:CRISPR-associated protein Csm3 [Thermoanaerobacter thermohydrosulfuricus]